LGTHAGKRAAIAAFSRSDALRSTPNGRASAGAGATDRDSLINALEKSGWVQAKAARLLNLTPRQIAYALGKYNIEIKKF
jgi:Nif-specific regulatory protein